MLSWVTPNSCLAEFCELQEWNRIICLYYNDIKNKKIWSKFKCDNLWSYTLSPDFANFLNKIYDLTGGELRIINQYQVGEGLELSSKQTDKIVYELCETGMIKKMARNKIVLSPYALYVIHNSKYSD